MADNSLQGGADTIRDKDRAGVKTQVFGIDVGIGTGTEALMSGTNPMPVYEPDFSTTGAITATDAVNAAPTGTGGFASAAPTANSYVALQCPGGDSTWDIQLMGTFGGGTVYFEGSFDATSATTGNWIAVNGRQAGVVNTTLGISTATAGAFRGNTSGLAWVRARIVGASAPSVAVTMRVSSGVGAVFLNASIPAGTNTIGAVRKAPSITGTITSVTAAITSTQLLAANTNRLGATVYNDGTATLYLALATSVSTTAYTVQVPAGGYYELPNDSLGYVGQIWGIWAATGGAARVTELT